MRTGIAAGSILIEEGASLPDSILLQREAHSSGWSTVINERRTFDNELAQAGWTYFFLAREIKATAFGFNKHKRLRKTLKRLIGEVKLQDCNSIEISHVRTRSFLGFRSTAMYAHARHLQQGNSFSS